jgi:hypothetical protein
VREEGIVNKTHVGLAIAVGLAIGYWYGKNH